MVWVYLKIQKLRIIFISKSKMINMLGESHCIIQSETNIYVVFLILAYLPN